MWLKKIFPGFPRVNNNLAFTYTHTHTHTNLCKLLKIIWQLYTHTHTRKKTQIELSSLHITSRAKSLRKIYIFINWTMSNTKKKQKKNLHCVWQADSFSKSSGW